MVALSGMSERICGKCLSIGVDGTMMEHRNRTRGRRNDYGHS